jgi:hypothetical protein
MSADETIAISEELIYPPFSVNLVSISQVCTLIIHLQKLKIHIDKQEV